MRLSIRTKLVLSTVLPVVVVYALLFGIGVTHIKDRLSADARRWLVEHAGHQAARLALAFSQAPALAEGLGDLVLAEPDIAQNLLYAHLIDGLRRTPIAQTAGVAFGSPARAAQMHRGAPAGQGVDQITPTTLQRRPGWDVVDDRLRFDRPIYRRGQQIGGSWVELEIAGVYREIERLRSPEITLFLGRPQGELLRPNGTPAKLLALASAVTSDIPHDRVQEIRAPSSADPSHWLVRTGLPGLPWDIVAVTSTESALESVRREAMLAALALLLSLAAIVLIIGLATRRITRPLATLDASVQQIASGNFAVAPRVRSNDELGGLADAIRRMAGHIADRESQLRSTHQVLEQRVAKRTSALQDSNQRLLRQIEETRRTEEALRLANEQAQKANRAKSEFLSNMSHELRTPLHGVLGYTQILLKDDATTTEQRENLVAIERCGQHLLTLINDILDLTRIEAGQMRVDVQPTDLRQLLHDVRTIVAQRAHSKGLALHLEMDPKLPETLLTDPVKLRQILLNLLGNAVKFTDQGTVTLRARAGDDAQLDFEVEDTGIGIPNDKIDAIFDAFHQAREGRAVDGTGLGLAINQRLIALLGGQALTVDSTPGSGSSFRFRLPLHATAEDDRARSPTEGDRRGALRLVPGDHCSVIVVEAVDESRRLLGTLLRDAGCDAEVYAGLSEAQRRLSEKPVDLVLLDACLSSERASHEVSELRGAVTYGRPRFVALSARGLPDVARLAERAGFDAYLEQPFADHQLFELIGRLLGDRFDVAGPVEQPAPPAQPETWPKSLARDTAARILHAVELGDIGSLFQLAEELADQPGAPLADVENLALMARMFDFDGLRAMSERLQPASRAGGAA